MSLMVRCSQSSKFWPVGEYVLKRLIKASTRWMLLFTVLVWLTEEQSLSEVTEDASNEVWRALFCIGRRFSNPMG